MLTEFERMKLIGNEFPLPLVAPAVIAKVDAVALAVERAVLETRAEPLTVRAAADGWGAVDENGDNVGGGCSLEGWLRAVRWTERQHGIGVCAKCGLPPGCPDCRAVHDVGIGA